MAPSHRPRALVGRPLRAQRTDAYMLLKSTQRPRYEGAEDIGSWRTVLAAIGVLGAITNVGMLGLAMPQLHALLPASAAARVLVLVLAEHAILLAQACLASPPLTLLPLIPP